MPRVTFQGYGGGNMQASIFDLRPCQAAYEAMRPDKIKPLYPTLMKTQAPTPEPKINDRIDPIRR